MNIPTSSMISLGIFVSSVGGYLYSRPIPIEVQQHDRTWMQFEKTQLQSVHIERPDGASINLQQQSDHWTVQHQDPDTTVPKRASKTMINRIKHQLHNLDFREEFIPQNSEDLEHYGLGTKATKVRLHFLGHKENVILVGDLNPSKVSYYVQHGDGVQDKVYTVKKSSMDMFLQNFDAFRESRIINIDMRSLSKLSYRNDSQSIFLKKGEGKDWSIQRSEDVFQPANRDVVMRMIGRLSALKAVSFVDVEPKELSTYGFTTPRLTWSLQNDIGQSVDVLVGKDYNETLVYYWVRGSTTVFVAKKQLLSDFSLDSSTIIEKRIFRKKMEKVSEIALQINSQEHHLTLKGGDWYWYDGSLVPGITPQRLYEELRDALCEDIERENSNDSSQSYALLKIQNESDIAWEIDVFEEKDGLILHEPSLQPCYLANPRLKRIIQDVERESKNHQQK